MAQSTAKGPNQSTKYAFPPHIFGSSVKERRYFKPVWFQTWKWLDYQESSDSVLCYLCAQAAKTNTINKALHSKRDESFISKGFVNWKDACASFRKHESSSYHIAAVKATSAPQHDIGEMLSKKHSTEKALNGRILLVILQTLQFLGRQGLPCRGHEADESNFIQVLNMRSKDNPEIKDWINHRGSTYTSPEIQNEILSLMANSILRSVIGDIQKSDFYTIMVDECVNVSNTEQLAVCFRFVDDDLSVREEFVGLYQCPDITADTLVTVLMDILLRFNLDLSRCRGQCYDGGSNMAGCKKGVKTQILARNPVLYSHTVMDTH